LPNAFSFSSTYYVLFLSATFAPAAINAFTKAIHNGELGYLFG
jgi:hypothetical protein